MEEHASSGAAFSLSAGTAASVAAHLALGVGRAAGLAVSWQAQLGQRCWVMAPGAGNPGRGSPGSEASGMAEDAAARAHALQPTRAPSV